MEDTVQEFNETFNNMITEDVKNKVEIEKKNIEEIIREVAQEKGITEDEVKRHLVNFQHILYKKYAKNKVNKSKTKAKRKQAKKSRKRNR